ncbi:MAG: DUF401 family protein [Planctomycetes bacterium]|nr:DUF401 family protein [Planctomycetota bacterium]
MYLLLSVPYLARVIISLFAIMAFQKLTGNLAAAMALGTVILAFWTGQNAGSTFGIAWDRFFSQDTMFLVLVIAGVICLSSLMSEAGIMKDLVICLRSRLSKRSLLAALPAVVGLLPMPAGALFSAPLIDDADSSKTLDNLQKTRINFWFRHVWEFWWPLYPGVLLAVDISGLPIWLFVLILCPLFFAAIAAGYAFLFKNIPQGKPDLRGAAEDKPFPVLILPILAVIGVYCLLLIALPALTRCNKYLPMFIGVLAGLAVFQRQRPAPAAAWQRNLFSKRLCGLVLIIILARIYGAFIEAELPDGILLMVKIRSELDSYGIPALALVVLIPFISGLTTGITVGYIGASFPIALSLAGAARGEFYSVIIISYTSGFLGMMLSPIHVCLLVTNDYFKTSLIESLAGLLRPALMLLACAVMYASIWYALG